LIKDKVFNEKEAEIVSGKENIIVAAPKDDETSDQASTH
jgi:hypothetical protein